MIHVPDAPSEGREIIRERLRITEPDLRKFGTTNELEFGSTFQVYTAAKDSILSGGFLAKAIPTAWKYVIGPDEAPRAMAEISSVTPEGTAGLEYAALYSGEEAAALLSILDIAKELPQVAASDWERRLLRAPSLDLLAIWLRGSDDDLLFPVNGPRELQDRRMFTEAELVAALRNVVRGRTRPVDVG